MLPEVRKILYSTDLSRSSTIVFEQACYLAKKTGAEIHILHVVEKLSGDARFALESFVGDESTRHTLLQERVDLAEKKLAKRQDAFWKEQHPQDSDVRKRIKSIRVVEAYPAETVIEVSKQLDVDLIVMGTHEKGMLHRLLGSVAKNVLNHSHIPVLIVPLPVKEG